MFLVVFFALLVVLLISIGCSSYSFFLSKDFLGCLKFFSFCFLGFLFLGKVMVGYFFVFLSFFLVVLGYCLFFLGCPRTFLLEGFFWLF